MRLQLLAGLAALASTISYAGEPLFRVSSTQEGLKVPYYLCADGMAAKSCYKFTAYGRELFIKCNTKEHPSFKDAGIMLQVPGYTMEGCTPYKNGYCLFSVNNTQYTKLFLK